MADSSNKESVLADSSNEESASADNSSKESSLADSSSKESALSDNNSEKSSLADSSNKESASADNSITEMTVFGPVSKTQFLDLRNGICPGSGQSLTVAVKAVVKKWLFLDRSQKPNFGTPGKGSAQDLAKT